MKVKLVSYDFAKYRCLTSEKASKVLAYFIWSISKTFQKKTELNITNIKINKIESILAHVMRIPLLVLRHIRSYLIYNIFTLILQICHWWILCGKKAQHFNIVLYAAL